MRRRIRNGLQRLNLRSEKGQTFVMIAAAFPVILGVAAIVIDGTRLFVAHQQTQNAADAASLAAGLELPPDGCTSTPMTCPASVQDTASKYSQYNGGPPITGPCTSPSQSNCWITPVVIKGVSHNWVQVRITEDRNGYFANAIGLGSLFHVQAVAAASPGSFTAVNTTPGTVSPGATTFITSTSYQTTTGGGAPAILFAYGLWYPNNAPSAAACNPGGGQSLQLNGQNNVFHGAVWSNGGVGPGPGTGDGAPVGDPNGAGLLYYVDPCTVAKPGQWLGTITEKSKPIDWPVPLPMLTCSDGTVGTTCPAGVSPTAVTDSTGHTVQCTVEKGSGGTWQAPDNVPSGVYCSSSKINLGKNEQNAAFVAPEVDIPGNAANSTFSGYVGPPGGTGLYNFVGGLFADGYGSGGFSSSAGNVGIKGGIFAPAGTAKMPGGGVTQACQGSNSCGFIEAVAINFPSNGSTYQGLGPPIGQTTSTTATIVSTSTYTLPGTTGPGSTGTTTIQQNPGLHQ